MTVTPTVTLCFSLPTLSHFSPGSGSLDCAGQVGLQKPLFQINFASLEKYASHKANQFYNVDTYMNFFTLFIKIYKGTHFCIFFEDVEKIYVCTTWRSHCV